MGKKGVGVLQERDQNEPVVDPGEKKLKTLGSEKEGYHIPEVRN